MRCSPKAGVAVVSLASFIVAANIPAAGGADLTGEWHGTEICDEIDNGRPNVFVEQSPIFIVQQGRRFRMIFRLAEGTADVVYEGLVQRVGNGDREEAMAIACGGDFRSQEVVRLRPIELFEERGFFNGESQFFTDDFPGAEGAPAFGTCKYAYRRVSTERPTIRGCETSPVSGQ